MNKIFDLSKLTTAELLAVKNALVGQVATGGMETKAGKVARALRAENEELKRERRVREFVLSVGLDYDADPGFYLDLDKQHALEPICEKMCAEQRKSAAEKHTMKVPPVIAEPVLDSYKLVREEEVQSKGVEIVSGSEYPFC
jgi:hypothetical protein